MVMSHYLTLSSLRIEINLDIMEVLQNSVDERRIWGARTFQIFGEKADIHYDANHKQFCSEN